MTTSPRNPMSVAGTVGVMEELFVGRLRWDLIHPFPSPPEDDRKAGDEVLGPLRTLLTEHVDPESVDLQARLPEQVLAALQRTGYLAARVDPKLGGLGLSLWNTFRVVEAAAAWSTPVGMVIATENGLGVGALREQLPPGPLRDLIDDRLREGTISGTADTEPTGAMNFHRFTTATRSADGTGYLINGHKLFVSNAPVAKMLVVSATVAEDGEEHRRLFVVDTDTPGLRIRPQEYMGIKGFPNGWMVFDNVWVPRERMVAAPPRDDLQMTAEAVAMVQVGRILFVAGPALALARQCLTWAREFVMARTVNGRPLAGYEEIQRHLAESAADIFAIEAAAEWALLEPSRPDLNLTFERIAAKNIASVLAWRVGDRLMSVLGGEGYETLRSKRARDAARPFPVERALRDLRAFRIAGGVDFQIDNFVGQFILSYYYPEPDNVTDTASGGQPAPDLVADGLSERNAAHLRHAAEQARALARLCGRLRQEHPDQQALFAQQRRLGQLTRFAQEILTVSLVLARAARQSERGDPAAQQLADVYCTVARHRLADLWHRLNASVDDGYRQVAARVLEPATPPPHSTGGTDEPVR